MAGLQYDRFGLIAAQDAVVKRCEVASSRYNPADMGRSLGRRTMLTKIMVDRSKTEALMAIGITWIAFLVAGSECGSNAGRWGIGFAVPRRQLRTSEVDHSGNSKT